MLQLPQAPCSVVHRFGPGIYIREVTIPAGTWAIGHRQKTEHANFMLTGRVHIMGEDQSFTELVAPLFFVGKPGKKIGFILEDMVWQNIYATTETDIAKLEEMFIDKSNSFYEHEQLVRLAKSEEHEADRQDYLKMLEDVGIPHKIALAESENDSDRIDMRFDCIRVLPSSIQGKGVFLTSPVSEGQMIAPARVDGFRTEVGRYTNHSATPNAKMVRRGQDIDLVALRHIDGCMGGGQGEEITIDYRQALAAARAEELLCQQ